jgi:glycosyltransferase involved in cell wall biosynthesis
MSGSRPLRTIGILPALGSGLTDLRRTGQHERLLDYDLRHYCEAYDRVYYFSYFREVLTDFTRDPLLLEKVMLLPRRGWWPARAYAFLLPFVYRRQFGECEVLRVEQFPGVIPALIARWRHRVPFVVTYGYHYGEVARIAGSRLKPLFYGWLARAAFPRAAGVIITSHEMETILSAHPCRPRLGYFPNGVDTESFSPPAAPRPGLKRPIVLYVGRLEEEKNLARLIEALAVLTEARPRLRLVGNGRLRGDLERRARAAGVETDFVGVVPHSQLPAHFRSADCFALPSFTEGHPKALIEAMACGLPCAASARGGIPSILEDGVTGVLFDPGLTQDIARAVGRILSDRTLARDLGERARASALARYDANALLKAEVAFVQSVSGAGS